MPPIAELRHLLIARELAECTKEIRAYFDSAPGQPRPPAAGVSFAATSDSRDTRSCKARPQCDCRVGLRDPTRVAEDNAEGALFHATPPQRASVRVGDPGSAGARTRCAMQVVAVQLQLNALRQ